MKTSIVPAKGSSLIPPKPLTSCLLGPFTVGLIDGDGSLQVNHWRRKILQLRLVVKLADKPLNYEMLCQIAKAYGGSVKYVHNKKLGKTYVQWVINNTHTIRNSIVPLLGKYPPLTTRIRLQLQFVVAALNGMSIDTYFETVKAKYSTRSSITPIFTLETIPSYFGEWLGGFIEAEGSFASRVAGNYSFSIAQSHDYYLIEAIRSYFGLVHLAISTKVTRKYSGQGNTYYEFSVGSAAGTGRVIDHCQGLLQGYKYYQLAVFVNNSNYFADRRSLFWTKEEN